MSEFRQQHLLALYAALLVAGVSFYGKRELDRFTTDLREHPYAAIAKRLNEHRHREACDVDLARRRSYASRVVDNFRAQIQTLWQERGGGGEPKFSLLDLGAAKLRISQKVTAQTGFDSSAWSWDEAYGLIQRTQQDPANRDNKERWRDVDSMVKFLLEKDLGRQVYGQKFLPPDITQHKFRPNPDVRRSGPHEFTVALDPGHFKGHEATLSRLLEDQWQGQGFRVKIDWTKPGAYRLLAHSSSNRSFVNHRKRTMEIANLAWTRTVAHELGHVLGFDDHYYNVWNSRNCYYSQESRLADLMSNSEKGGITPRHWEILDKAYPWQGAALTEIFSYAYGK